METVTIPDGETIVKVTIIDNGARISGPFSFFMEPPLLDELQKIKKIEAPAYVFLVEHEPSKRRLLFDLGIRKNIDEYAPAVLAYHTAFQMTPGEEIFEFLQDRHMDLSTIEGIVWSHHHLDHIGNPAGFPQTTDLIVGPGFKETVLPGYPSNPKASILENDYKGRRLREINFDEQSAGLSIGGYRAVDYFGDGSFYLLETPGHTVDHLAGLARTNASPAKFILMAADIGHHPGAWLPNKFTPLPQELTPSPLGPYSKLNIRMNCCPCDLFLEHVHPKHSDKDPFMRIKPGHPYNHEQAQNSLDKMEAFEADENIMVIIAHDTSLLPVLEFYPQDANSWHEKNWKQLGRWRFLQDFAGLVENKVAAAGE